MHHTVYRRAEMDYMSRKEGGRPLITIEDGVDTLIGRYEDYIKQVKEGLIMRLV